MKKAKSEEAPATPQSKSRKPAFRPTQAQRGFVAAAAGLGVPRRVICQMLPGANPGETVTIRAHLLRDYFSRELREGMKLVVALVGARVCQRALSGDDRGAHAAQMLVLNTQGNWKPVAEAAIDDEPPLDVRALTREERDELKRLLTKATQGKESDIQAAAADAAEERRTRLQRRPT
jgi:hypothetical protein